MAEYKSNYTGEQIDQAIAKANTALQEELEPSFNASPSKNITANDISNWNNKAEVSDIPDVSNFITKDVNDLTYYELATATGNSIVMSIDSSTYVLTVSLKNSAGTILNTQTVDLPLETMVVGGSYDNVNKKVILTLKNGNTIEFSVADLIGGLQSEITSNNKLSSDLVDDTNNTNKFVSESDKTNWNGKYAKPIAGIPKTDLAQAVQDSLDLADSAVQDVSGKEDKSNKITSLDSTSTDTQYPSAKSVWDLISALGNQDIIKISLGSFVIEDLDAGIYLYNNTGGTFGYKKKANDSYTFLSEVCPILMFYPKKIDVNANPTEAIDIIFMYIINGTSSQYSMLKFTYNTNGTISTTITTLGTRAVGSTSPGYFAIINGAQTIPGVKTFSSIPKVSSYTAPTDNTQLTAKKYVDDSIASAITTTLNGSY